MMGEPMEVEAATAAPTGGGIMTAPGPPTHSTVKRAIAAGDLAAIQRYTAEFGPASLQMDDDPDELTALHYAAAAGREHLVQFLLAPPVNADACAARGNRFTPLHCAAMNGHASVCAALIRVGANVNAQTDPQGYAPLHTAAFAGHVEALRVLLAGGADRSLLNHRNETPAETAARTGQDEAHALLVATHP
jgi:ankyrin repeat protein